MKFIMPYALMFALLATNNSLLASIRRPLSVLYADESLDSESDQENKKFRTLEEKIEEGTPLQLLTVVAPAVLADKTPSDPLWEASPIIKAICKNDADTVVHILQEWAQNRTLRRNINAKNKRGETALHIAAASINPYLLHHETTKKCYLEEKRKIVHALIHAGARLDIQDKLKNMTPIKYAVEYLETDAQRTPILLAINEAIKEEALYENGDDCPCAAWGV